MEIKRKRITIAAVIGGIIVMAILILGTLWMGQSAKRDSETAVRSVSMMYLDELAGRREQVVAANLNEKVSEIRTALKLITAEDLRDAEHLQAYQMRVKELFNLERFAFVVIHTHNGFARVFVHTDFHKRRTAQGISSQRLEQSVIVLFTILAHRKIL